MSFSPATYQEATKLIARLKGIAVGEVSGIYAEQTLQKELDSKKEQALKASSAAAKQIGNVTKSTEESYANSNYRDTMHALAGRVYLRALGLRQMQERVLQRAKVLHMLEGAPGA